MITWLDVGGQRSKVKVTVWFKYVVAKATTSTLRRRSLSSSFKNVTRSEIKLKVLLNSNVSASAVGRNVYSGLKIYYAFFPTTQALNRSNRGYPLTQTFLRGFVKKIAQATLDVAGGPDLWTTSPATSLSSAHFHHALIADWLRTISSRIFSKMFESPEALQLISDLITRVD